MNLSFEKTAELLGKRIRDLRKAQGLTQQELGEKADMNYKFIGEIERGNQNPSIKVLLKIADALDIELLELFWNKDEFANRKDMLSSISKIVAKMPDESLQTVIRILRSAF
jgi:transcriptional regulator with XRE-family HTH domain